MCHQREKSPRPDKFEALSPTEMRRLIKDYGIEFRGLLTPSQWPGPSSKLFHRIREIGKMQFDEYTQETTSKSLALVREMKDRAVTITRRALEDRKGLVSESTLRANIEPLVFERFQAAVKCRTCSDYLWLSEVSILPGDQTEAEKLERRYKDRQLCQCPPPEMLAWESTFDEPGETLLFKFGNENMVVDSEIMVEYQTNDGPKMRRLRGGWKPDRIYGLAPTKSFEHFSRSNPLRGFRHSPFKKADILYPFIIVEAKAEDGGLGFEAIEAQTAFPIRTCLKLQEDLSRKTGIPLDPFVWFMCYQGDEWRVAACITHQHKYQVIDLWMGRVTSRDGALQLLHIVDAICVWARDIYRFDILCCLAGGKEDLRLRYSSPTATYASRFSTQEPQTETAIHCQSMENDREDMDHISLDSVDISIDPTDTSNAAGSILQDTVMEDFRKPTDCGTVAVESDLTSRPHPLMKWATKPPYQHSWDEFPMIRHSNMILFSFSHLSLHDDFEVWGNWIEQVNSLPGSVTCNAARFLSMSFESEKSAILTTRNRILELKSQWLRAPCQFSTVIDVSVRALFSFHTYIRTSDWQIVRELRCISCTPGGLQQLISAAVPPLNTLQTSSSWSHDDLAFPSSCFNSLHSLTQIQSASAAMNSTLLYLVARTRENNSPEYQWQSYDVSQHVILSLMLIAREQASSLLQTSAMGRAEALMEVLEKPVPRSLERRLGPLYPATSGALLFLKGPDWPTAVPNWCLMVMEELDFEDRQQLGRILTQARKTGSRYIFDGYGSSVVADLPRKLSSSEKVEERSLDQMIKHLLS